MEAYARFAEVLLDRLVWTSIQAAALIGAIWLLCRWLPRWSPAMRCLLWWLVGLQLVLGLALGRPLELPLLAPQASAPAFDMSQEQGPVPHAAVSGSLWLATPAPVAAATRAAEAPAKAWPWRETLVGLWLIAMALQLFAALREWRETRAVIRAAEPVQDAALRAQCAEQARSLGLRRCPQLRCSDVIVSPQVAGPWRPVVLLPKEHTLDATECSMALAHELAHLRRGDLWLGWIPALAQRAFFFHPLARWAMREYAFHREAACDAQVLDRSRAEPQDYGRLLLRLGVAFPVSSGLAGASPTFQNLKRRLTLLQQTERAPPRLGAWLLVMLIALAGALPYRVTARGMDLTVRADGSPAIDDQQAAAPGAAPTSAPARDAAPAQPAPMQDAQPARSIVRAHPMPVSAATPAPKAPVVATAKPAAAAKPAGPAMAALASIPAAPPLPPAPIAPTAPMSPMPAPPVPPTPPPVPASSPAPVRIGHVSHVDVSIEAGAPRGFAIIEPNFITLQGTESDLATARSLQRGDQPLLWIRRGTDAYVVRDRALLQRAKETYAPMSEMARTQGQMAGRQGELAGQQGGLAVRTSALAMRRLQLDSERTAIRSERLKLRAGPQGDDAEAAAVLASFDGRLKGIDEQLADLDRQRTDIDREQTDLNRRQTDLSRQQADVSRHERDVARQVDRQLDQLIDEAVADGLAQPSPNR